MKQLAKELENFNSQNYFNLLFLFIHIESKLNCLCNIAVSNFVLWAVLLGHLTCAKSEVKAGCKKVQSLHDLCAPGEKCANSQYSEHAEAGTLAIGISR